MRRMVVKTTYNSWSADTTSRESRGFGFRVAVFPRDIVFPNQEHSFAVLVLSQQQAASP